MKKMYALFKVEHNRNLPLPPPFALYDLQMTEQIYKKHSTEVKTASIEDEG